MSFKAALVTARPWERTAERLTADATGISVTNSPSDWPLVAPAHHCGTEFARSHSNTVANAIHENVGGINRVVAASPRC